MSNKKSEMSEYEFAQLNHFIYMLYQKYGKGLEFEECRSMAYMEYVETRNELGDISNREFLWICSKAKIIKAFTHARKVRNQRIEQESKLSLNQTIGESQEPVYTFFRSVKGDFVNGMCLWHDMGQFEEKEFRILLELYCGYDDWEIMKHIGMGIEEYFEENQRLRRKISEHIILCGGNKKDYHYND